MKQFNLSVTGVVDISTGKSIAPHLISVIADRLKDVISETINQYADMNSVSISFTPASKELPSSADTFNVRVPQDVNLDILYSLDIRGFVDFIIQPINEVTKGVFVQCDETDAAFYRLVACDKDGDFKPIVDCIDRKTAEATEKLLQAFVNISFINADKG